MKFAAIGRTRILLDGIQKCIQAGHQCTLIITSVVSDEDAVMATEFEKIADQIDAKFVTTRKINTPDVHQEIINSEADVAISLNWRYIIGQETLDLFSNGIINSHAGDLPRFRGNATPNWAILTGETYLPITLHFMTAELDAGNILLQRRYWITSDTRVKDIYDFSAEVVPKMFAQVLTEIDNGTIQSMSQPEDESIALRCYPRLPQDSFIDWSASAVQIQRLINAVSEPFNGAYTYMGLQKLIIWRSVVEQPTTPYLAVAGHVIERRSNGDIVVATGDDGLLVVQDAELEGQRRGKPNQFIKSVRTRLGMNTSDEIANLHKRLSELEKRIK